MAAPRLGAGRWSPEVRAGLEQMLAAPPRAEGLAPIAALDFDDTCLDGDISHNLLEDLDEQEPGLVDAYRRECAEDLRSAYLRLVGTLVGGLTEDEVRALALRSLERGLADGRLRLVPEIAELVSALHDGGWEVWIVTASPASVVRAVAHRYGLVEERILGMVSGVDAARRYTTEVLEPVTYREGKLAAFRGRVGRDPDFAAGDSASDRFLLDRARHALLIDRGDRVLREEALTKGWWIQESWR